MIGLINSDAMYLPLPDESVHCVITSPPYFDLRIYSDNPHEVGRESAVNDYIKNIVCAFDEVWRVLRSDGTCWVNIGDSFNGSGGAGGDYNKGGLREGQPKYPGHRDPILKSKDLCLVPARFAIAMQERGWYVRADVIWHKTNGMPSSAKDRPLISHEYLFVFAKKNRYYYDQDAIRYIGGSNRRSVWSLSTSQYKGGHHYAKFPVTLVEPCIKAGTSEVGVCPRCGAPFKRVISRSVDKYHPEEARRRIGATGGAISGGTERCTLGSKVTRTTTGWEPTCKCREVSQNDLIGLVPALVCDPFCGSGTVGVVCKGLGRSFIGADLSYAYLHDDARPRLGLDKI